MIQDRHDILVEDYQKNVIQSLIPGVSQNLLIGSTSSGQDNFTIELGNDFAAGTRYDTGDSSKFIHFTNLKALYSIINENTIRLYNLKNVNDPNELKHFAEGLLSDEQIEYIKANTYILSLCDAGVMEEENINILNLWRLYGNEGLGVAIEFNIEFHGNSTRPCYFLGKVIYEKSNNLKEFIEAEAAFKLRHNNIDINNTNLKSVPASFHKSPYYKVEEEMRLMYFEDNSTLEPTLGLNDNFKCDFSNRNELVTYHTLKLGQRPGQYPWITIKKIQIGFRHSEEAFEAIKNHFTDIYRNKNIKYWIEYDKLLKKDDKTHPAHYLGEETSIPIIEHSPLKNIYR